MKDNIAEFRKIFGDRILEKKEDLVPYMKDASYFEGNIPMAAVIPKNSEEISKLMKICSREKIQVVMRSGGSALTGSPVPNEDSILISMSAMNRILETHLDDGYIVAEPGLRLDDLNNYLSKLGFFYPPDPASSMAATVGGSISTNAGGLRACTYGTTKEWILGLELVLPSGEIVEVGGRTLKRTKGYDITALMAGNEGTLAIITKAYLKIWPIPEEIGRILAYFKDVEKMGRSISELKGRGIIPYIAEFMDKLSLETIKKARNIDSPEGSNYLLMIDIASTHESIDRMLEDAKKIIEAEGPIVIRITRDKDEMAKMYEARKGLYSSSLGLRDFKDEYIEIGDVVVPPSQLPESLIEIESALKEYNLKAVLFGHIGDGNIHANILVDLNNKDHVKRVEKFQMAIAKIALKHGGSVSAEHGIGLEKKELLLEELRERNSMEVLTLMKNIKKAFDPEGIMNRGKIFD
ncbi:MAG: FAD-binding oxidoreductase [Cuniculiplasma sp.]|jgi:glycolate oxidase|nr:FAD-binding oxidoreductase [Cuniculiplasma sp.]